MRKLLIALPLFASSLLAGASAQAGDEAKIAIVAVLGTGVVIADINFIVRDVRLITTNDPANPGVSIAETAVGAPQALMLHTGVAISSHDRYDADDAAIAFGILAMMPTALTAHGIYTSLQPDADPGRTFGVATIIGINTTWTHFALQGGLSGYLPLRQLGVAEMITTTPSIGASIYGAVTTPAFATGYLFTAVWSGLLFLHGAGSIAWAEEPDDDYYRREPLIRAVTLLPAALPSHIEGAPPAAGLMASGAF